MGRTEFCKYVNTYKKQFYIVAYAILKNEAEAEDAVCNAILKAYEHLDQLRNPHKFKAWFMTIIRNEALMIRRKRLFLPGDENVEKLLKPVQDHYDELWDIVQTLKEEYRIVIVLFYYNNSSMKEISQILDIPMGTVKSRLNRGREMLKTALENEGGSLL